MESPQSPAATSVIIRHRVGATRRPMTLAMTLIATSGTWDPHGRVGVEVGLLDTAVLQRRLLVHRQRICESTLCVAAMILS
jgi:hypothetical protein